MLITVVEGLLDFIGVRALGKPKLLQQQLIVFNNAEGQIVRTEWQIVRTS